jgi:hypothetical protein
LFEQLFEEIVARCLEAGLVEGNNLSEDGSFVEANASKQSRIPRQQLFCRTAGNFEGKPSAGRLLCNYAPIKSG